MDKTFKQFLDESIKKNPELGTYIHFCKVLSGSGATREEITEYFNVHMPKDEYDKSEKTQLIDYLISISNDFE